MKKDSWLNSDSFLKRAFAIWGHYFVANLIIAAAVMAAFFVLALVFGSMFAPWFQTRMMNGPEDGFMMEERSGAGFRMEGGARMPGGMMR